MDAFFASVEQRDHPEWRGLPVIVGSPADRRGVVCTASYEARQFGVRSAMPSRTAARLCPQGIFVRPDHAKYSAASRVIRAELRAVSEQMETLSLDEAFLDVTGTVATWEEAEVVAARLKARVREVTGLTASVGVGPNKLIAKLASDFRKPDGLTVVRPEQRIAFLAPMPVERLWGVGPVTARRLRDLGWETIGAVQGAPESDLMRLGRWGAELGRLARGEDDRPVEGRGVPKSIGSEETFDRDTRDTGLIRRTLRDQAESVAAELRREGLAARTVTLKLRWGDFTTVTRSRTLHEATQDAAVLHATAWSLALRERGSGRAVRLVGLSARGLGAPELQMRLWEVGLV